MLPFSKKAICLFLSSLQNPSIGMHSVSSLSTWSPNITNSPYTEHYETSNLHTCLQSNFQKLFNLGGSFWHQYNTHNIKQVHIITQPSGPQHKAICVYTVRLWHCCPSQDSWSWFLNSLQRACRMCYSTALLSRNWVPGWRSELFWKQKVSKKFPEIINDICAVTHMLTRHCWCLYLTVCFLS